MSTDETRRYRLVGPLFDEGFSIVPNAVLRERRYSGAAKLVWALLYDYSHRRVEPELDELAADLGVGVKVARRALKELEEGGSLRRRRRGLGLPNSYELLEHPPFQKGQDGLSGRAAEADPTVLVEDLEQDTEANASGSMAVSARKRNVVFDALASATAANPAADGGMIAKAAKAIRGAMDDTVSDLRHAYLARSPEQDDVPPEIIDQRIAEEIERRAATYRRLRPDWELTPTALAKHWNRIPTWTARGGSDRMTPEEIARGGK